jgi:hypothetical protein
MTLETLMKPSPTRPDFRYSFLAAILTWTMAAGLPAARAADPIDELVQQAERPTMAQFLSAMHPFPSSNPILPRMSVTVSGDLNPFGAVQPSPEARAAEVRDYVAKSLPGVIAQMERAYPGAVWAPLGRDAVALGDALDAFYQSLGETGRVSRLNASRASFGYTSPSDIVQFLESAGLDLNPGSQARPFIVFDFTGMSSTSQSTQVMRAGYAEYRRRGGRALDLIPRFNLLSLQETYGRPVIRTTDLPAVFKAQQESVITTGMISQPLAVGDFPANGILLYAPMWHDSFGAFHWDCGKFTGTLGTQFSADHHLQVLSDDYEIARAVSEPSFLQEVERQAQSMGYSFLARVGTHATPVPVPARQSPAAELQGLVDRLGPMGEQTGYLSDNGEQLSHLLKQWSAAGQISNELLLEFQSALDAAYGQRHIGDRDYRRLVAAGLSLADTNAPSWIPEMKDLAHRSPNLAHVLAERAEFFLDASEPHGARGQAAYQALEQAFLSTLRCELKLSAAS